MNSRIVLGVVLVAYALSWFLPIIAGRDTLGYEGAQFAMETLRSGLRYFTAEEVSDPDRVSKALLYIIAGSCNVLFIVTALFSVFRPLWGYALGPLVVCSMLVWFSRDVGVGYYLWTLSGAALFWYCLHMVRQRQQVSYSRLFTSAWSLPVYLPILIVGMLYSAL